MKLLWIEDFDGDKTCQGIGHPIRQRVEQFYGISADDLLVCTSFQGGLEHIRENPQDFDGVLLDINLKFAKDLEKNKLMQSRSRTEIYDTYFQDYITEEIFDHYYEKGANGILIYLYLREVACFPKNRIAFLSAYVEEKGKSDGKGNSMDYQKLLDSFRNLGIVFRHGYMKPDAILCKEHENFSLLSGFTEVEEEAEIHPESERFKRDFLESNGGDYIDFRRNMIEMAKILREECDNRMDDSGYLRHFIHILRKPAFHKDAPSGKGTDIYHPPYFYGLLQKMMHLPLEPQSDTLSNFLEDLLFCGDCFSESEQVFSPSATEFYSCRGVKNQKCPEKKQYQVLHGQRTDSAEGNACTYPGFCKFKESVFEKASISTLKTMRNWLAHGGSGDLQAQITLKSFVAPLFLRTIFDVNQLPEEKREEYLKYEGKLLGKSSQIQEVYLLDLMKRRYYVEIEKKIRDKSMKPGLKYTKDIAQGQRVESLYQLFLAHNFPMSYQFLDLKEGICRYQVAIAAMAFDKYDKNSAEYAYISVAFREALPLFLEE